MKNILINFIHIFFMLVEKEAFKFCIHIFFVAHI